MPEMYWQTWTSAKRTLGSKEINQPVSLSRREETERHVAPEPISAPISIGIFETINHDHATLLQIRKHTVCARPNGALERGQNSVEGLIYKSYLHHFQWTNRVVALIR
jgi:hypothetical protein